MIGAGLFINPRPLAQIAGPYGFLGCLFAALMFLPIILCIATLAKLHPVSGGLYVYSRTYLGEWAGFLSGWSYFIGKTTTIVLLVNTVVKFFQSNCPLLAQFSTLAIDYVLIACFIILNIIGLHIGGKIQYAFTFLKAIPIIFVFIAGSILFDPMHYNSPLFCISDSMFSISTATFALLGFEVICAIGHLIENSKANIKKVIITAFLIVSSISLIFQILIFGALGQTLSIIDVPIFALGMRCFPCYPIIASLINGAVFMAIFGGFFSILTSNCWNLHALATNNHLPFANYLTRLSKTNVPWVSLCVEGILGGVIITITSHQTALQNMSVFAQTISFLLSVIAAYVVTTTTKSACFLRIVSLLGIASCCFILVFSFLKIMQSGISFPFLSVFLIGVIIALIKQLRR